MARKNLINDMSGIDFRTYINDNFIEVYDNLTSSIIKQNYELNPDTNAYTDAEKAQLATNTSDITSIDGRVTTNETDITNLQDTKAEKHELVFSTVSYTTQEPVAVDTPIQVAFGAVDSNAYCSIDALGNLTFLQAGDYAIHFRATYGRTGNTGTAILFGRFYINSVPVGDTLGTKIDNAATVSPYHELEMISAGVNDVLKLEIYRDSTGVNEGGLYTIPATLAGWTDSPSAKIEVYKI